MSNFYESEPMTAYSTFYYAMANLKPSFDAGAGAQHGAAAEDTSGGELADSVPATTAGGGRTARQAKIK